MEPLCLSCEENEVKGCNAFCDECLDSGKSGLSKRWELPLGHNQWAAARITAMLSHPDFDQLETAWGL